MMIRRSRAALFAATILSLPVAFSPVFVTPAAAQWVVYDPTNYVQNVDAERAAAAEQGREQRRRFLTPGSGYQPGNARMFPNGN